MMQVSAHGKTGFRRQQQDMRRMEDLLHTPQGDRCATNQVLYNLRDRSIERDLLPWCERHGMLVMAYSPFGGPGASTTHTDVAPRWSRK